MWILGALFVLGILLAASDGLWFPWLNLIGVAMIGAVGMLANRMGWNGA